MYLMSLETMKIPGIVLICSVLGPFLKQSQPQPSLAAKATLKTLVGKTSVTPRRQNHTTKLPSGYVKIAIEHGHRNS